MQGRCPDKKVGWVVSDDEESVKRLQALAESLNGELTHLNRADLESGNLLGGSSRPGPVLVILDIDHDLDWGVNALNALRRARLRMPLLVLSDDFSRAFGKKIVSQGVQYYFSRDFSTEEVREVLGNFFATDLYAS